MLDDRYPSDEESGSRDRFRRERERERGGRRSDRFERRDEDRHYEGPASKRDRSLSPDERDRRHKYRRSVSPRRGAPPSDGDHYIPNYERDGYSPAPRYGNRPEFGSRESTSSGQSSFSRNRSGHPDPYKLDYLVSFKQFCEYLRAENPSRSFEEDDLRQRYGDYKEDYAARQAVRFFEEHKEEAWFREKYAPGVCVQRLEEVRALRKRLYTRFVEELMQGEHDEVCFDQPGTETKPEGGEARKEGEDKQDTKEEGEEEAKGEGTAEEGVDAATEASSGEKKPDVNPLKNHLVIKSVSPNVEKNKLIELCKKVEGFEGVALSEPMFTKKFHRIGWIQFKEGTDLKKAVSEIDGQKIDDFQLHVAIPTAPSVLRPRVAPDITCTLERLRHDCEQAEQLAQVLDRQLGEEIKGTELVRERVAHILERKPRPESREGEEGEEGLSRAEEETEMARIKIKLDMFLNYMRQVHLFCYYDAFDADSVEEFRRKCPRHYRVPPGSSSNTGKQQNTAQWAKNLDLKLDLLLKDPKDLDLEKYGGKNKEKEMDRFLTENIDDREQGKFRCKICNKPFRGPEFVRKHLNLKHAEKVKEHEDSIDFLNNFIRDPGHMTQPTGTAPPIPFFPPMFPPGMIPPGMEFAIPNGAAPGGLPPTGIAFMPFEGIPRIGFPAFPAPGEAGWPPQPPGAAGGVRGAGGFGPIPMLSHHRGLGGGRYHPYQRLSGRGGLRASQESLPPPPGGARSDPRQIQSYVDLDAPAEGDVEIKYG
ncbi:uncharacterized protein VTP21DRAFT_920 [Calcarisporiella thermophila]|uniref:uncharacterized protein n=1 Tax=Calcarisporiella thermophila TaxID=911321 RepID=UPI00374458A0